ncbi:hypothetical protein TorRG33x02_039860, partial [Trema orientale]
NFAALKEKRKRRRRRRRRRKKEERHQYILQFRCIKILFLLIIKNLVFSAKKKKNKKTKTKTVHQIIQHSSFSIFCSL